MPTQNPDGTWFPDIPDLAGFQAPPLLDLPADPAAPVPAPEVPRPDIVKVLAPVIKPPPTPAAQVRKQQMQTDLGAFSASGNVAKSDSDVATLAGTAAGQRMETAKATAAGQAAAGDARQAGEEAKGKLVLEHAEAYQQEADRIHAEARTRWAAFNQRTKEEAARVIDPHRVFSDMSTAGKVGWALQFIGAGMQGGNQVAAVQAALNNLVESDIAAQKANQSHRLGVLEKEREGLLGMDKADSQGLTDWLAAKNLRLEAIGKMIDAKVANQGAQAAAQSGLLAARDAVNQELLKVQTHAADHLFQSAERQAGEAASRQLAILQSGLRKSEDEFKAGLDAKKAAGEAQTLPTGTGMGLSVVDKSTGKKVEGAQLKLRPKMSAEEATKAGAVVEDANAYATSLQNVRNMLKDMSNTDLMRGGTPEFRSAVKQLVIARAKHDNGARLSDQDIPNAAMAEFGAKMDGFGSNMFDAIRSVGPYKDGVLSAIDKHLTDLSTSTMHKLSPYVDSTDAQRYNITFNVQDVGGKVPDKTDESLSSAILSAAGRGDVAGVLPGGPRQPDTKPVEPTRDTVAKYLAEKDNGRGQPGGLPRLDAKEEKEIDKAVTRFDKSTVGDILKILDAYKRNPDLTQEAKNEISMEAARILPEARAKEQAVEAEALSKYVEEVAGGEFLANYRSASEPDYATKVKESAGFKVFLESDVVDEMRKRVGLVPRKAN